MANDIIDIIVTDNSDNVQLNVTPNLVSINVSQTSGNIIGSNYYLASTFSALPITGDLTTLYVINDTSLMYRWSGSAYTQINSSAVVAWGQITGTLSGQTDLQNALNAKAPLASPTFTGTVSGITKSMVGLSNVDNTSDINKPISTATQTALNLKADINNPTFTGTVGGITKAMVGLGNVDNTSDVNKPISSATQTALDTKAPLASPTFTGTVSGITKSMVGLGNVDNTTDLLKPISTATQSALNLKYDASNPAGYTTNVGTVTSVGGTGTVSGLSLSGSVTTSGNLTLGGTLSLTSGNVTTALGYTPYNATNPSGYISGITSGQVTTALGYTPENSANKGIANGYASLDGGGLVPSTQLPSYVDDVLEFADLAAFPASGTTGKIYVALDTNKIYRWSGATYIEVSPSVGTIWGGITGTLSNQTDLQNALNTKQDDLNGTGFVKASGTTITYDNSTYYPYPTGNTTQYVSGDGSLIAFPVAGQSGTLVRLVRNQTGATLTKGTVVYISGATGNNPIVEKALATSDATSAQTFGLCQANIANNAEGYVVLTGDLTGLDTSAFTEGQQLYLSPTTAGTYTATKQYAPNHLVYIGVITRSHPTLGQIEVKIQNGYELDEIHNVSAQSPANNDIIAFNTSNSLWEKKSIATALGFTPYNATNPNNYIALTALSSSATGLTYTNTTGVFSLTAGYAIPTTASATNWDSAYTNRITSLTTTGSSGSSTLISNVLNIPTYTLSGLGGITATFLSGTSGISYNSTTGVISTSLTQYTDALARASVSLTTTGTSGASTYNSTTGVLNIPNYGSALSGYLPLTGGTLTGALSGTSATMGIAKLSNWATVGTFARFGHSSYDTGTNYGYLQDSSGNVYMEGTTTNISTTAGGITNVGGSLYGTRALFNSDFLQNETSKVGIGFAGGYAQFNSWGANTSTYGGFKFQISVSNGGTYDALKIAPNGAATFAGNVTIDKSSPLLQLNAPTGTAGEYRISNGVGTTHWSMYSVTGGSNSQGNWALYSAGKTGGAGSVIEVTPAGNVGIGGPGTQGLIPGLVIGDGTDNKGITLFGTTTTQQNIAFTDTANSQQGLIQYDHSGDYMRFFTNSSERMRITSGGSVNINSTQTTYPFYVQTAINNWMAVMENTTAGGQGLLIRQTGGSQGPYFGAYDGGAYKFFVAGTGVVNSTSTSITIISSDIKLKTDIRDYDKGLAEVLAMKPRIYKRKDNLKIDEVGFIAQEMDIALTGSMIESYKDKEGEPIHTYQLEWYPLLVKAIQELSAKVSLLENK